MARQTDRLTTLDAVRLHEDIPPERWCVRKADLRLLQLRVEEAIETGDIDASDSDSEYGPSIYTVCEEYIKPVTAEAGKMSWALMMNPGGLHCDLFVSHAWQEGIFEFLEKVLASWPQRARHAWCCMLANPQNLNIGSMLQSPKTSPFALALQASRFMLVVPNRHQSIYTRLWCGYEAYVASEKDKVIRVATSSLASPMRWCIVLDLVPLILGALCGIYSTSERWDLRAGQILIYFAALVAGNTASITKRVSCWLGLFFTSCIAINWMPLPKDVESFFKVPKEVGLTYQCVLWLSALIYFLLADLDEVRSSEIARSGLQLRKGYSGSMSGARCSRDSDRCSIWYEVGDKAQRVDEAISVLILAGLSSPKLRLAQQRGVNIRGAGHAEMAIPVVFLGPQLVVGVSQVVVVIYEKETRLWANLSLEVFAVLSGLIFMCLIYRAEQDERCFMFKVITKIVTAIFLPWVLLFWILQALGDHQLALDTELALLVCFTSSLLLALFFGSLGIQKTLELPAGARILQLVYWHLHCRQLDED